MRTSTPKVLHSFGSSTMLNTIIEVAQSLRPEKVLVVHSPSQDFRDHVGQNTNVSLVEQKEQLGTGDAVKACMGSIDPLSQVLVLVGDIPMITKHTLSSLIEATPSGCFGLLTATVANPYGLGRIIRNDSGQVRAIVEQKDATQAQCKISEINTGIFLLPGQHLEGWLSRLGCENAQREYYLTDVLNMAVDDGVDVVSVEADEPIQVLGVNDLNQLVHLKRAYQKRQASEFLASGVLIEDPSRFDLRGELLCGQDVRIDINVIFEGEVRLGDGVHIGPNCVLKNCEIGAHTSIEAGSHLEGAIIGAYGQIGPMARLRPGTVLKDRVKVGNFVETKNTQMSNDSKANHLSYLGDCSVGKEVNVGAGVITCNYDGAYKHQTTIGDRVHIGSDCQLVAPVTIGADTTIGAGSTVTQNTPSGKLVLTHRLDQRSLDWQRPTKEKNTTKG